MSFNKIIGYLLLFIGLAIIFWCLYSSYNIFTAKTSPPEIFSSLSLNEKEKIGGKDIQAQMEKMIKEQFKEIISPNFLPKLFNLISWSIIAGILIFGGAQISNLGIKLLAS